MPNRAYPSVGVAVTTYNGANYIVQQLDSFLNQTLKPNQVIVRDDGSSDETLSLVNSFIESNGLTGWDAKRNPTNLGFVSNFLQAALALDTDVVFFSDQDDIWLSDKIETAANVFSEHRDALVVACDASIIDENGKGADTLQTVTRVSGEGLKQVTLAEQVSSMLSSGLTLAVRRDFLHEMASVISKYDLTHDCPMGLFAAARNGFYRIGKVQVLHRVHSANTSAPMYTIRGRLGNKTRHIQGRVFQLKHLEALMDCCGHRMDTRVARDLEMEIAARHGSIEAMEKNDILFLIKSVFRTSSMKNSTVELANVAVCLFGRG